MTSRSDETRRRLLDAARNEFAMCGIAGARTSRIAAAAGVNEALIFRYFGNKQALFTRVYESLIVQTVDDVPMDASDLGGYAGALFDYYACHDQVVRLAVWAALEAPDTAIPEGLVGVTAAKVAAISRCQEAGLVSKEIPADDLLALVIQLSLTGASAAPALGPDIESTSRRRSIVNAVRTLAAVENSE
ncbi:TetR family transcriptional regulator [Nesterenkonia xinjiangensis]|uniref:AcrR family transcriptional regulator n=1 Tax=Nesterenkonia xinjiangensis TaxID=225327 RepID=A0A7Z0GNF6_9MICC|nr:TetR family transcriptional regulator [Nesterenkonia xinjiangensis]NYJ78699.1 AcrR family transcriptional regulator [Nesterenkonia xinjiangensis]